MQNLRRTCLNEPVDTEVATREARLKLRKNRAPEAEAQRIGLSDLAGEDRRLRILEPLAELLQKIRRQKRKVDRDHEIGIGFANLQSGGDAAHRPQSGNPVGQGASANNPYAIRYGFKEIHHMVQQTSAMPIQAGFVPAHSDALSTGKYERVHAHGVDTNSALPLI